MSDSRPTADDLDLRPLSGSERPRIEPRSQPAVPVPPGTIVEASVVLRRRAELPSGTAGTSGTAGAAPISAAELAERYGADPADVRLVTDTLTGLGVRVMSVDGAARLVRIAGPVELLSRVFGTSLREVHNTDASGTETVQRLRSGGLSVPAVLDGVIIAVLGLDDRPQARAMFRVAPAAAVQTSYTPTQLARIYNFPEGTDGAGETIAIIELGGGFAQADLDAYFAELGISGPTVTAVSVDGAANAPGQDPDGADGEVLLDIEVAGGLAPAAQIVVYFAPNTDAGFLDAVVRATHATPTPAAISISWGQNEDDWTQQARNAMSQAFGDAATIGVTVTAAAGDDGSSDRATDGRPHVDFPASSPNALACGGTRLEANPLTGAVSSETVWNNGVGKGATGGGVSDAFSRPSWQARAGVPASGATPGRGVPDVAAVADPQTGYRIRVDGKEIVIGGTSAVAPLWAALVARLVQATGGLLGPLQPKLYGSVPAGSVAPGFRDITIGDNGAFSAESGWDACTGLGVPNGADLLTALGGSGGVA